jgi:ligand-binding sensor domain-containing protein
LTGNAGSDAVYVGTPAGVAEIRDGKVTRILARGRYARALLASQDGLLVGQMEGGVFNVSAVPATGGNLPRRAIAAHVERIAQLRQSVSGDAPIQQLIQMGQTRYAVSQDQLLRQEPDGGWQSVLSGGGAQLTDGNISALMAASDGRIWVGFFDRGLDVLPATGGAALHVENDQVFCVNRILENERENAVAVATANGLALFDRDGREKQVLTRSSGLIANHVTDVALYGHGMVVGTPAGITFLDDSGAHSIYAFQGLVNNHVYALGVRGSELVAGTLGGISLVKDGAVKRNLTTANSGLKANWITALIPVGDGWLLGTYGAGVLRLDGDGSVHNMEAASTGTVINPGALLSDGRLVLAGTLGRGLLVGDATGTRWKMVTAGLPSLNVTALAVRQGMVYIGTDNGLVRIAEGRL